MSDWSSLLLEPDGVVGDGFDDWFVAVTDRLLNATILHVGNEPHRFTELEVYYYGDGQADPFTHRDPIQKQTGHWYFHRTRGTYRGGSFKGVDLTFGDRSAFGGILVRGVQSLSDGRLIDGPSLTVDHLLARTEAASVAELDEAVGGRPAWDSDSPLRIEMTDRTDRPVLRTARVGLSLKRLKNSPAPPQFLLRPYRFLTEPRAIAKGAVHMVLALHVAGHSPEEITRVCGTPKGTVQRYLTDFAAGLEETDFAPYFGIDLGNTELCRLTGLWHKTFGKAPRALQ